ncbi:MAG: methylenetetrahydrofolate reductase [Rickettsiales bacterium]
MPDSSVDRFTEKKANLRVSAEFFPPKRSDEGAGVYDAAKRLAAFAPDFFSVTYGAGGGTRDMTAKTARDLQALFGVPAAAHITCVGQDKASILRLAEEHKGAGVERLVALRGDMPNMETPFRPHPEGFCHTAELVAALKETHDFDISVAAFPETHPEAPSPEDDVAFLKEKLDAGAARAITQFCFNGETILRFMDACLAAGIDKPIVPGIMPIRDFAGLKRFADRCGATMPKEMETLFLSVKNEAEARAAAVEVALSQCMFLHERGVSQFHFYCLNKADPTESVWRRLLQR